MDKRFVLFFVISFGILVGWSAIMQQLQPLPDAAQQVEGPDKAGDGKAGDAKAADGNTADGKAEAADNTATDKPSASTGDTTAGEQKPAPGAVVAAPPAAAGPKHDLKLVTLGSLDPASKQRMLVTLTTQGAAVEMLEVTHRKYLDVVDRSGYLGYLAIRDNDAGSGCVVGVVGPGTPAARAGLQAGDVIVAIDDTDVDDAEAFFETLASKRPRRSITLSVKAKADANTVTEPRSIDKLKVDLIRRPVSIVRPEFHSTPLATTAGTKVDVDRDPLSFLLTLDSVGEKNYKKLLDAHVDLRNVNWKIAKQEDGLVEFEYDVPGENLKAIKRYRLEPGQQTVDNDPLARAYHLTLDVEIQNTGSAAQKVAYRLDGPTGLPTAGWWYANKVQQSGAGLRDVARQLEQAKFVLRGSGTIADKNADHKDFAKAAPVQYMGVDALYFAAILLPQDPNTIAESSAVTIGSLPEGNRLPLKLTNVTSRLISKKIDIAPGGKLENSYTIFAGPKQRDLLTQYGPDGRTDEYNLGELIYYGWPIFAFFAKPLGWVLSMFSFVGNYGLAIIMLTICVRLCMFPISKKQAQNAMKMQELAPEMKRISEKYKKDVQKKSQALQEMYKKHNYSPLSGCLPLFIQMPIFIGLYKSLQANIELRGAALLGESVRWADNLSAPDMLLRWDKWMFFSDYTGWLGPYFNILPLCTVGLFLWQQKLFTPPATDEQSAMTQKMMKYMMFFMGLMFFKVPSGLCIYFIASSMWGIGERMLLPRPTPPDPAAAAKAAAAKASEAKDAAKSDSSQKGSAGGNGQGGNKKKQQRSKKKGKR